MLHHALADALLLCNFVDDAAAHYATARDLGLRDANLHVNLGIAYQRLAQPDK